MVAFTADIFNSYRSTGITTEVSPQRRRIARGFSDGRSLEHHEPLNLMERLVYHRWQLTQT